MPKDLHERRRMTEAACKASRVPCRILGKDFESISAGARWLNSDPSTIRFHLERGDLDSWAVKQRMRQDKIPVPDELYLVPRGEEFVGTADNRMGLRFVRHNKYRPQTAKLVQALQEILDGYGTAHSCTVSRDVAARALKDIPHGKGADRM